MLVSFLSFCTKLLVQLFSVTTPKPDLFWVKIFQMQKQFVFWGKKISWNMRKTWCLTVVIYAFLCLDDLL